MSEIILTIGGRNYTMACATGEEAHIAELGRMLHDKLSTLPGGASQNDSRSLLFAALLLADELFECRKSPAKPVHAEPAGDRAAADLAETLDVLADRLEGLADALETPTELSNRP